MEASLNLTSDMQPFVEQLILIERLQVRATPFTIVTPSLGDIGTVCYRERVSIIGWACWATYTVEIVGFGFFHLKSIHLCYSRHIFDRRSECFKCISTLNNSDVSCANQFISAMLFNIPQKSWKLNDLVKACKLVKNTPNKAWNWWKCKNLKCGVLDSKIMKIGDIL